MFLEQEQQRESALEMHQGRIFLPSEKEKHCIAVFHL